MWMQTIMLIVLHNLIMHVHFLACIWNYICVFCKKFDLADYIKSCPTAVFSCAVLTHIRDSLGFFALSVFFPVGHNDNHLSLLGLCGSCEVFETKLAFLCCVFVQSPEQGAGGASRGSHCASHPCGGAQGNGHSRWSNGIKKVISKTLPAFFSAPGRESFRIMVTTGCGDSLKCQPKQRLSNHCDLCPCLKSEVSQVHMSRCWEWWVCETLCCW